MLPLLEIGRLVEDVENEGEVSSLVLVQQAKKALAGDGPGSYASDAQRAQHESPLDRALRIIALHALVVHLDAACSDRVRIPVVRRLIARLR